MAFRRLKDNPYSSCPLDGRSIDADFLFFFRLFLRWFFIRLCEFGYEISKSLCFDGLPRPIFDIKLAEFNDPLNQSSICIRLIHCLTDRVIGKDDDSMRLEVGAKFSGYNDKG
jgi:hypothetical protein